MAHMKSCGMSDCTLEHLDFLCATLDDCSFTRTTASDIRYLRSAAITKRGATLEEVWRNREAVLSVLQPRLLEQLKGPAEQQFGPRR